jgi:glycogen debranching enzyme
MIALPGLTLATGRAEIARGILETFARHVGRGMLPNRFQDDGRTPSTTPLTQRCGCSRRLKHTSTRPTTGPSFKEHSMIHSQESSSGTKGAVSCPKGVP